ncbi:MAG: MFS transporter [Gemmataceae bacterium]
MATTLSPAPPQPPGPFRALRHRNYRLYFTGQLVSLTGSWVQAAALTWLAYELTGQSGFTGLVTAAQILPMLGLSVWGGSLADRWPRRSLIFLAQTGLLALALGLAALVALDAVTPSRLLAVSLLIGVVNAIDTPARLAFVVDMVGHDDLMNAVALNSLVFNVARALGPAVGAWLMVRIHLAGCFLINGLTFVALLAALLAMRLPPRAGPRARAKDVPLLDGFRHLRNHPTLILLLFLAGSVAFFGWPLLSLLPAFADRQLDEGSAGYSLMLSAIGAGALLGALVVATFGTPQRRRWILGGGVTLGAAALAALAFTRTLPSAALFCGLSGGGLIVFFATGQATMQLGAGEHNRGRVMGIWLMVLSGAQPAGNLIAGAGADRLGVPLMLLVGAAGIGLTSLAVLGLLAWMRERPGAEGTPG